MRKFLTFALILVFAVSLAAPFAAASSGSAEYPLISYPSQMFDSSVLCPVVVTDGNYDRLSSNAVFGGLIASMTKGNLYLFKYDESGKLYSSLLAEGNYSYCYAHNQYVYAVNSGKDVYRYDITTGEGSLIVSAEKDIDLLYGFDDLVFWSAGSSVYLFGIAEGKTKEIYKNASLKSFFPVTSNVVRVSVPNEFYEECLSHEFTDAASYYDWFISQKAAGPQAFSRDECVEYLSAHSVEEFLTVIEEISRDALLYIDFKNKTSSEDFEYSAKCREVYDAFVKEVDAFAKANGLEGEQYYVVYSGFAVTHQTPPQTSDSSVVFFVLAALSAVCCFAVVTRKKSDLS